MEKVQLTGEGILLRAYEMKDLEQLHSAARESLEELSPWMPWCHKDYNTEESRRWIEMCIKDWEEETAYQFAILDLKDGDFLGGCGLNHINKTDKVANLGYWVKSSRARKGVATTATLLLEDFGFKKLELKDRLNRIEILVAIENKASQRVAVKAGAMREGILRNRLLLHGKIHDAVMFSMIPK
jgi:RimJ/RimL family protein N-acetyltransferase